MQYSKKYVHDGFLEILFKSRTYKLINWDSKFYCKMTFFMKRLVKISSKRLSYALQSKKKNLFKQCFYLVDTGTFINSVRKNVLQ